jgi:hypothetical protein
MLTSKEVNERLNQLGRIMNDPRLDDTWKSLDAEFERRKQSTREWFNTLLRIGIAATIIQLVVLVFCVWYFTK